MQVSIESSNGLERRLRVQVPADTIESQVEVRLKEVGRKAKISGFRPGKVPAKVVKQQFGGQVRQEVLQEVLQSSYAEAVTQEKLQPAGSPNIEPETIEEGKDLTYVAVVEVYPDVEIKGLDKIKVKQPTVEIGDADIDEMIDNLRKQRSDWAAVDRKAGDGDRVKLDFAGTLNGEAFEGGSAEDFEFVIGEGQMLEDFEKGVKGLKTGDEKTIKVKFPKDYHSTELAGEKAEFALTIKEVAESVLPEIDEEFVKSYGIESGSADDLRADIIKNMERELDAKSKGEIKRQVMEGLAEQNPIEVPGVLVHQEAHSMQHQAMERMGIKDHDQAPPEETFMEPAEKRVRLGLLLQEVIADNKIEVDRDRVTAKVDELVAPYDQPDEIRNMYLQNPQFLGQVENVVLEEQVVEFLQAQAKVSSQKMSFKELMEL
ncbi:MAG: trigger factor [Gammaproteobacteria bacterium]|nr:trigger factor [Gammaproteobacteria bacterium]